MQEEVVVTKFQRYFRRALLLVTGLLATAVWVITAIGRYRFYIGSEGIIFTKGENTWRTGENGRQYLRFHTIINGSRIDVDLPADYKPEEDGEECCYFVSKGTNTIGAKLVGISSPVILSSEKLGQLKIAILKDIGQGKWNVKDTDNIEAVTASKYSTKQVNLLYQFLGHYSSLQYKDNKWKLELGSWTLAIPSQKSPKGFLWFVISIIILIKLYLICRLDREPIYRKDYNRKITIKMIVGIAAVLFLFVFVQLMNVVTIL